MCSRYQSLTGRFWFSGFPCGFSCRNCSSPFCASSKRFASSGVICPAATGWPCLALILLLARPIFAVAAVFSAVRFSVRLLLLLRFCCDSVASAAVSAAADSVLLLSIDSVWLFVFWFCCDCCCCCCCCFSNSYSFFSFTSSGYVSARLPPTPAPGECCWKCRNARRR